MFAHKIFEGMKASYERDIPLTHPTLFGELNYLMSTPQIVEMIIKAASEMLDAALPEPYITLGTHLDLYHEQPTLVQEGGTVRIELLVSKLEGHRVWLDVACYDRKGRIATAKYERAIVDKERFRFATYERAGSYKL